MITVVASRWHGHASRGRRSPEYNCWRSILDRCLNPNATLYPQYGGVGITCCQRWRRGAGGLSAFQCFLSDMGPRPSRNHTVDRFPNFRGNYSPRNCRWATYGEQARNRRSNVRIRHHGETLCALDLCAKLRIGYRKFLQRIHRGWTVRRAIQCAINPRLRMFTIYRKTRTLKEWARHFKIPYYTLYRRVVQQGWKIKEVVAAHT